MIFYPRLVLEAAAGIHAIRFCHPDSNGNIVRIEPTREDDTPVFSRSMRYFPIKGNASAAGLTGHVGVQQKGSRNSIVFRVTCMRLVHAETTGMPP